MTTNIRTATIQFLANSDFQVSFLINNVLSHTMRVESEMMATRHKIQWERGHSVLIHRASWEQECNIDEAANAGYRSAKLGKTIDSIPYEFTDPDQYLAWRIGFRRGQEER